MGSLQLWGLTLAPSEQRIGFATSELPLVAATGERAGMKSGCSWCRMHFGFAAWKCIQICRRSADLPALWGAGGHKTSLAWNPVSLRFLALPCARFDLQINSPPMSPKLFLLRSQAQASDDISVSGRRRHQFGSSSLRSEIVEKLGTFNFCYPGFWWFCMFLLH